MHGAKSPVSSVDGTRRSTLMYNFFKPMTVFEVMVPISSCLHWGVGVNMLMGGVNMFMGG